MRKLYNIKLSKEGPKEMMMSEITKVVMVNNHTKTSQMKAIP